ncbi:cobaltochelatase subunit CobN [Hoeflea prorocentri]|uniref:Cobaltochelatase subunit CobN n=1 Tax=Hoeflea prorocentri TaxID=1922333 RepID=A0A9X3UG91_9HYPH|nr:cobaltochelatase subunit CobN [Hoeflea prorocentri]MCY6380064.1 cobaltochelatase subunit CobN [Hoeflea prorocentri]MDA5397864.1 cobaltochelatase subunit CobN [Hoeflea prorocentri]
MHLLLAQKGTISDSDEAVDLGQSPGDIVFLSAADTELASLAAAQAGLTSSAPTLRLASLMTLRHPMSVDSYVERTAKHARLIVVRALGGASYFSYALECLHSCAVANGIAMAVLPGDDKPDDGLSSFSTMSEGDVEALWRYLVEGGAANTASFLTYCAWLLGRADKPASAVPLLKSGLWWPGLDTPALADIVTSGNERPVVPICFYRALVQSGQTQPVEALVSALQGEGVQPLPIFISSLKDPVSVATVEAVFGECPPDVVINATGFAVSAPGGARKPTALEATGAVVLQAIFSGSTHETWSASAQGLSARDLAMNVALPEVDGRVLSRAVSFKSAASFDEKVEANIVTHVAEPDRALFVARLAANWASLRRGKPVERRVALILANYPNRDGRLGNGVGLDTPAGTIEVLTAMAAAGYDVSALPDDGNVLMDVLMEGPTNAAVDARAIRETISRTDYLQFFDQLPEPVRRAVSTRWGAPDEDPFFVGDKEGGRFALPLMRFGNVMVGIQPARGYNIDPKDSYHSPDLVPPHGYLAFYAFLRTSFEADAVVHMGKHGNLEWLPGKALALSQDCYPEAVFGPVPHLYPFIVNDPGEGTQAKRRTSAVIIDHLTPPLTRAGSYGPLKDLEALVDEYYEAAGSDPRRLRLLKAQILDLVRDIGLDSDAGIATGDSDEAALEKLDAYLCDLKEMQIRDGLHIFGRSPEGRLRDDLICALARVPRGMGEGGDASLQRAIADDLQLGFDPLDCAMASPWSGSRPQWLLDLCSDPWRTAGDAVERIELAAQELVSGRRECPAEWTATQQVLEGVSQVLEPALRRCGTAELEGLLLGLSGRFVEPGPSGAPTRGRPDVLPTGRNFYSVDSRSVPTPAAWELGRKSAELLVARYTQDHGEWPTSFGLTAWGTSNMRTGGDDIAQALALIGAKPVWDNASRRVTGYEVVPLALLDRPRIDVTLRVSGFFRDAFPEQIALFDRAVRAIGVLEEDASDNPIAARMKAERQALVDDGVDEQLASERAGYRVFGSKPGAYGAGLQALIDEGGWEGRQDLAEAYLVWGGYAYGAHAEGRAERNALEKRLGTVEAVVQNQDNREHDLLDSDDYYQFEGGMTAAVEALSGNRPSVFHNDHSRPAKPVIRTLEEEIARVVRGRAVNPKWIDGVMRHGYKGAFEIAATVDYLFAFAATTGAVRDHHFEAVYQAFILDDRVRDFIEQNNRPALREMAARLDEAITRGLWVPRSNSAQFDLRALSGTSEERRSGHG